MFTRKRVFGAQVFCAMAVVWVVTGVSAQTCGGEPVEVYSETFEVERQVDPVRYVRRAVFSNNARGDYILEFTARRTDLPDTRERWTVTFEKDENFDYVRRLEIDAEWMHTFKSRTVDGVRLVSLAAPGSSVEIGPDDQPNSPAFEAFLALASQTAEHRAVVSSVRGDFPHWDYPPLGCIADCITNDEMCGHVPVCDPPDPPTACDCWEAYECCMSEYLSWHLCAVNCICTFCYDGFVEECCARMGATQAALQEECEEKLIKCLSSHNLLPCPQN